MIEKLVLSQLSDHLSANSLYNRFQSAYRPGHSTETAPQKIVNDLLLALDDGNVSLLPLLDLSVSIHCYTSEPAPISFGVPQGSVLGPVLFVLYTAPLSTVIEKHSILHHLYADDSQLQKSAPSHQIPDRFPSMQKCNDDIKSWMTLNKLKLNDEKSEAMIVSSGQES